MLPWLPLWAIAVAGVAGSLVEARGHMRVEAGGGSATVAGFRLDTVVVSVLVLFGVLAMRAAVIFCAPYGRWPQRRRGGPRSRTPPPPGQPGPDPGTCHQPPGTAKLPLCA